MKKKGNILLINGIFKTLRISEPIGICSIAAVLRKAGHEVHILEPRLMNMDIEEIAIFVNSKEWTYIGISTFSFELEDVYILIKKIKEINPQSFVVLGGLGPTLTPEVYLNDCNAIDTILCGEGEYSSLKLVELLLDSDSSRWKECLGIVYAEDGVIHNVPVEEKIANLDDLPYMSRDVLQLNIEKYGKKFVSASIMGSRGCFGDCSYCWIAEAQKKQPGLRYRQRSIKSIVGEIKYIVKKYGVTDFSFEDDNFIPLGSAGVQRAKELREELKEAGLNITFFLQTRPDTLNREVISALKEAGLAKIFIGIEAISQEDVEIYNKENLSEYSISDVISMLAEYGYLADLNRETKGRIRFGYIAFHQLTTLESIKTSVDFFRKHKLTPKRLLTKVNYFDGDIAIKQKLTEKGLFVERSPDIFAYYEVGLVYEYLHLYADRVLPIRESIRDVEKHVFRKYGNKNSIQDLSAFRNFIDESFYGYINCLIDLAKRLDNKEDMNKEMKIKMNHFANQIAKESENNNIDEILDNVIELYGVKQGMHNTYW